MLVITLIYFVYKAIRLIFSDFNWATGFKESICSQQEGLSPFQRCSLMSSNTKKEKIPVEIICHFFVFSRTSTDSFPLSPISCRNLTRRISDKVIFMINDNIAFGKLMFDFIEYLKLTKAGITNITTVVSFASLSDSDEFIRRDINPIRAQIRAMVKSL